MKQGVLAKFHLRLRTPNNPQPRQIKEHSNHDSRYIYNQWKKRHIPPPPITFDKFIMLINGEYEIRQFRDDEKILFPTFPELNLTAEQAMSAGK